MSRIAKAQVNRVLENAAKTIVEAGGKDGRTSRADIKEALKPLQGTEKKLVDMFFRFIDNRDFKAGAQVTASDVKRAVEYAKEKMVAKYDLNKNGLSSSEVKKMSLTGKLAVDLAKALKEAGVPVNEGMLSKWNGFYELRQNVTTEKTTRYNTPASVPEAWRQPIIEATNQSTYEATTLEEAFDQVDQNEFIIRNLKDPATGEKLVSIDYGAGDSTYGAIFSPKGQMVARIHDGDIEII